MAVRAPETVYTCAHLRLRVHQLQTHPVQRVKFACAIYAPPNCWEICHVMEIDEPERAGPSGPPSTTDNNYLSAEEPSVALSEVFSERSMVCFHSHLAQAASNVGFKIHQVHARHDTILSYTPHAFAA